MLETIFAHETFGLPLLAIGLAAVCAAVYWVISDWRYYSAIPGLGTYYPFLGHFPTIMKYRHSIAEHVRRRFAHFGHPSIVLLKAHLFDTPRYITIDPRVVEHMLKTNFDGYEISRGVRGDALRDFLGDGIFNADGKKWLIQRKLASREFSANRFRFFMSDVFNRGAAKLVRVIEGEIAAAPKGSVATIDLHRWFFTLTLDAFSEIAFGLDVGGLDNKPQPFVAAFDKCQEACFERTTLYSGIWPFMKLFSIGPEGEIKKALEVIDNFVYSVMDDLLAGKRQLAQGRADDSEEDLLRRLLPAAKRDDGTYDRVLVRDMLLSLIIAGRDTTAASMSWTVYELMQHPRVLKEVLDELDAVVGPSNALNFDNVGQCHFLQAVLSESQRLHPSVPFDPKTAIQRDVLPDDKNQVIQKGDLLIFSNIAMGVSPKLWGPDASEFKPSRWMQADGTCRKEDQFKYPAFNGGKRLCLGLDMANLEMKVVLGTLLRKFDFALVPGQNIVPAVALTLQMQNGLLVHPTLRK